MGVRCQSDSLRCEPSRRALGVESGGVDEGQMLEVGLEVAVPDVTAGGEMRAPCSAAASNRASHRRTAWPWPRRGMGTKVSKASHTV